MGDTREDTVVAISAGTDQSVVDNLERMLERAKAGDFTCVAFAALTKGSKVTTGWSAPPRGNHLSLVGAVDYLKWRMHAEMDKE